LFCKEEWWFAVSGGEYIWCDIWVSVVLFQGAIKPSFYGSFLSIAPSADAIKASFRNSIASYVEVSWENGYMPFNLVPFPFLFVILKPRPALVAYAFAYSLANYLI
jgi:hypothetical protein